MLADPETVSSVISYNAIIACLQMHVYMRKCVCLCGGGYPFEIQVTLMGDLKEG